MPTKTERRQMIRDAEDRARRAAEREEYRDVEVGAPCPRCAAILRHAAKDRALGIPPGSWADEICWLCQYTGAVVAS
jgi:hypothetical protein